MATQATLASGPPPLLGPEAFGYWNSFSKNISEFLAARGTEVQLPELPSIRCWFVNLSDGARLHIYAEQISEDSATCDQCRIIGWGTHPVSSIRYHFIVPAEIGPDSLQDPTSLPAIAESCCKGSESLSPTVTLPSSTVIAADGHVSPYNAPSTIFDSSKHRLHGVLHANGFGHLLRVNGREGGSQSHTGQQLVVLWDNLCQGLRARRVTVEDVSSKAGMELRVLYTAAYGHTWYGSYGYVFGRGPYNTSEAKWTAAANFIAAASLAHLMYDFDGVEGGVSAVVRRYRLPIGNAVRVKDLGTLLYRLLWLQAHPEEALQFFDPASVAKAEAVVKRADDAEAAKRAAQRAGSGKKAASAGPRLPPPKKPKTTPKPTGSRGSTAKKTATGGGISSKKKGTAATPAAVPSLTKIKLRLSAPSGGGAGAVSGASPASPGRLKRGRGETQLVQSVSKRSRHNASTSALPSRTPPVPLPGPNRVIGRKVRVYYKVKRTWYNGVVERRDPATGLYLVAFRDFQDKVDLSDEMVKFLDGPMPPASVLVPKGKGQAAQAAAAAAAARAAAVAAAVAALQQDEPEEQETKEEEPAPPEAIPAPETTQPDATVAEPIVAAIEPVAPPAPEVPVAPPLPAAFEEPEVPAAPAAHVAAPAPVVPALPAAMQPTTTTTHPGIGAKIKVYSRERRGWKIAFVTSHLPSGLHGIEYLDGRVDQVDLSDIRWQMISPAPEGDVPEVPIVQQLPSAASEEKKGEENQEKKKQSASEEKAEEKKQGEDEEKKVERPAPPQQLKSPAADKEKETGAEPDPHKDDATPKDKARKESDRIEQVDDAVVPQADDGPSISGGALRSSRRLAKKTTAGGSATQESKPEPPVIVEVVQPLRYKAKLARDDGVERARQLTRSLKSLFPNVKPIFGESKSRGDIDAALIKIASKGAPEITYKGTWWESLPRILHWAQGVIDGAPGKGAQDAAKTVHLSDNVVEINRAALHALGMFPDSWPAPFEPSSLRKANAKALEERNRPMKQEKGKTKGKSGTTGKTGAVKTEEKKEEQEKEVGPPPPPPPAAGTAFGVPGQRSTRRSRNHDDELYSLPDVVIPCEVRPPGKRKASTETALKKESVAVDHKAGDKDEKVEGDVEGTAQQKDGEEVQEKAGDVQVAENKEISAPKSSVAVAVAEVVAVEPSAEAKQNEDAPAPEAEVAKESFSEDKTHQDTLANGAINPPSSAPVAAAPALSLPSPVPSAAAAAAIPQPQPPPAALQPNEPAPCTEVPALSVEVIQRLVAAPPGQDQLPGDTFPHPSSTSLIPLALPTEVVPWGQDRLALAVRHVLAIAKAHRDRWVSPQRIVTLAQQSFSKRGLKEISLAQTAMAYLGNTTFDGWAIHRVEQPQGGMYYLTEEAEVPTPVEESGNGIVAVGGDAAVPSSSVPVLHSAVPSTVAVGMPMPGIEPVAVLDVGVTTAHGVESLWEPAAEAGPSTATAADVPEAMEVGYRMPDAGPTLKSVAASEVESMPVVEAGPAEDAAAEGWVDSVLAPDVPMEDIAMDRRNEEMLLAEVVVEPQEGTSAEAVELMTVAVDTVVEKEAAATDMEIEAEEPREEPAAEVEVPEVGTGAPEEVAMVVEQGESKEEKAGTIRHAKRKRGEPLPQVAVSELPLPEDQTQLGALPNGKPNKLEEEEEGKADEVAKTNTDDKIDVLESNGVDATATTTPPLDLLKETPQTKGKSTTFKLRLQSTPATEVAAAEAPEPVASQLVAPSDTTIAAEDPSMPLPVVPARVAYPGALPPAVHAGQASSSFLPLAPRALTQRTQGQQEAVDAALALALTPVAPLPPIVPVNLPPGVTPPAPPQLPPWMHLEPGADIPLPPTSQAAKAQVSRDLHHLFTAVLKVYAPQVAKLAAERAAAVAGERAATRVLKLKQLPDEVQVLRDTKHFQKVCSGETLAAAGIGGGGGQQVESELPPAGMLRLWCKLAMPPELATPAVAPTRFGRKFLPVDPPAELIVLPGDATLGQFMEAVTQLYRGMYRMCTEFTVMEVVSGLQAPSAAEPEPETETQQDDSVLPNGNHTTSSARAPPKKQHVAKAAKHTTHHPSLAAWDPSMPLAPLIPKEPPPISAALATIAPTSGGGAGSACAHGSAGHASGSAGGAAGGGASPLVPTVIVAGVGLDTSAVWLHAGGPEDWIVACSCGTRDDDGEAMVACDMCEIWYHTRCVAVPDDCSSYICAHCQKRASRIVL